MSLKAKLRKLPDNWGEIVRQSKLGKPRSEETKRKISETRKKRIALGLIIQAKGEDDSQWKGVSASYRVIHHWVQKNKGKAIVCVECGSTRFVQWANISGKYMRDLNDYKSLCKSCHNKFDGIARNLRKESK